MANAELAGRILDAIESNPDAFDMDQWHSGPTLSPEAEPECGTTLCVAGWAAHLSGWTLDGSNASKGDEWAKVSRVACDALGLTVEAGADLFYAGEDYALNTLREMAGR